MRIGIQLGLHGHAGRHLQAAPRWADVHLQVETAERAGFDIVTIDDALVDGGLETHGYWEAMSLAGAVAATSTTIEVGHSVVSSALRRPALIASAAATLDEISGGRYVLGLGAGNVPLDDEAFGIPLSLIHI